LNTTAKAPVTARQMQMQIQLYGGLQGKLYTQFSETPYVFYDIMPLIRKMDEIFDTYNFPKAFTQPRTFGCNTAIKPKRDDDMQDPLQLPTCASNTFVVDIKFRQNATWQGCIHWVDKNKKQTFRSALEMLRLMDEAMNSAQERREAGC